MTCRRKSAGVVRSRLAGPGLSRFSARWPRSSVAMSSPEQRWSCHSLTPHARKPRTVLAGQEGLEPPTTGFGDRDSSQLSYCPVMAWPERNGRTTCGSASHHQPREPMLTHGASEVNRHQWVKCSCPALRRRTVRVSDDRNYAAAVTVLRHDNGPSSHLRACQRDYRVGNAGRGRESESTQGGGQAGDRLRRRGTGLPHA